jgi:hypothetical protein
MSTPSYRLERLRRKHCLLRVPARARPLRLVLERFTPTSRPPRSAGGRRWPVRRCDLEVFLAADAPNDWRGSARLATERDSSARGDTR